MVKCDIMGGNKSEVKMNEKEKAKDNTVMKAIFFALLVGIIVVVIWFLTYKQESHTSSNVGESDYSALECTASDPSEPFFAFENTQEVAHTIKVLFSEGKLKDIMYKYDGTYASQEAAEDAEAWLHADYNEYLGANGVDMESLSPTFSVNDNKLMISLYAEAKKVNDIVARLFFMDTDASNKIKNFSLKDYKLLYETKGFACQSHS